MSWVVILISSRVLGHEFRLCGPNCYESHEFRSSPRDAGCRPQVAVRGQKNDSEEIYKERGREANMHTDKNTAPVKADNSTILSLNDFPSASQLIPSTDPDSGREVREAPEPPLTTNVTPVIIEDPNDRDFEGVVDDDPELISYIRQFKLHPPATHENYNLRDAQKVDYSRYKQSAKIDKILKNMVSHIII